MIASLLVGFLILVAASLVAAIVGTVLRPKPPFDAFENYPQAPWAATRCGNESLKNLTSPAPSGEKRGWRPTADVAARRRPHAFFRRAL
jgi:hypothetical protein